MSNLVTVKTFTYPHEAAIIQGRLESEGIECFLKDELIIQTINFYSNAMGGVKLQVKEEDVEQALTILKEAGYLVEKDFQPSPFWIRIENWTRNIPLLNRLRVEARLLLVAGLVVTVGVLIFYWLTLPSLRERLTAKHWCLQEIKHNGEIVKPKTTGGLYLTSPDCENMVIFSNGGSIRLPGLNSWIIDGKWNLSDDVMKIEVFKDSTLYDDSYTVYLSGNSLVLTSEKTTIYCQAIENKIF